MREQKGVEQKWGEFTRGRVCDDQVFALNHSIEKYREGEMHVAIIYLE